MFKKTLWVRAFGRKQEWERTQVLECRYSFCGFTFWKKEIDRETVPSHVAIEVACLGGTAWRSKFSGIGALTNRYGKIVKF
jgi:hypothetical protein